MQIDVIDPKKTAMIVVDMQNDFVAPGAAMETPAARQIVPKLAEALRICRERMCTAAMDAIWGCSMTFIRQSPIVMHWLMVRRAWKSTLIWPQHPVST
jgi:nicotinamidase-related amidase